MPEVRYVCLSDLHLGAQNSILTNLRPGTVEVDVHTPSPALTGFVDCLRSLTEGNKQKPTLILAGDILEFALATDNEAAMVFEMFVEQALGPNGIFDDTVYFIPGNHDHHLWEGAREKQYASYVRSRAPKDDLEVPWHTTRMRVAIDPAPIDSELLTSLVHRKLGQGSEVTVRIVYPNLALDTETSDRHVFIHHGHFIEALYTLMSNVQDMVFPEQAMPWVDAPIWDWEAENFAWIDFFWSSLGRSGAVGRDVGIVYASLQSREALRVLQKNLARGLAQKPPRARWVQWVKAWMLGRVLGRITKQATRLERTQTEAVLSTRATEGLHVYVACPLRNQVVTEYPECKGEPPKDVTFVFGHTHKPFEAVQRFDGYPRPVWLYNTGGWVVDTKETRPLHGAAAILFDQDLNSASLRLYNQASDKSSYRVEVAHCGEPSSFSAELAELVDPGATPWKDFSLAAAGLVEQRHRHLDAMIRTGHVVPPQEGA